MKYVQVRHVVENEFRLEFNLTEKYTINTKPRGDAFNLNRIIIGKIMERKYKNVHCIKEKLLGAEIVSINQI